MGRTGFALRCARGAVRWCARLVPRGERERWWREWDAELVHWWTVRERGRGRRQIRRLLLRALVAAGDAARLGLGVEGGADNRENPEGASAAVIHTGKGMRMDGIFGDARVAIRKLALQPLQTGVVLLTLALGIGATTAIFSVVHGIALRPLPYPEPDRLVSVWPDFWFNLSIAAYFDDELESYESFAVWGPRSHVLLGDDGSRSLDGPRATTPFLDVLDPPMALGRGFVEDEDQPGNRVVVLTHGFWQRELGGDPDVLGMSLFVRGAPHTVVGVTARGAELLMPGADLVIPVVAEPGEPSWGSQEYRAVARLRPGVSVEAAQAELDALIARMHERFPLPDGWGDDARLVPLRETLVGDVRPTLFLILGAAGLTLLIAVVNVANVLLMRALSREREVAMRLALGATSGRILRQMVTESTVLAVAGGLLGVGAAYVGLPALVSILPQDLPRLAGVEIDPVVLGFALAVSLVAGWLMGLAPAAGALRTDVKAGLSAGSRSATASRTRRALRKGLVAVEVALVTVLLAGSGMLLKGFVRLTSVDPGLDLERLLVLEIAPQTADLSTAEAIRGYYDGLDRSLTALPGVVDVEQMSRFPLTEGGNIIVIRDPDNPRPPEESDPSADFRMVSVDFLRDMEIRVLRGRHFGADDGAADPPVAILSEAAADALYPGMDPLGLRVTNSFEGQDAPATVVGVAADLKSNGLDRDPVLTIYRPFSQTGGFMARWGWGERALSIRTAGEPVALVGAVRRTAREHDRTALIRTLKSGDQLVLESVSQRRAVLILTIAFAATAAILGAVGIYGVLGFTVVQRFREIGIRIALGAEGARIVKGVVAEGLWLAGLGAALGVALTVAANRIIEGFAFQVSGRDPWVLAATVLLTLAVAGAAALAPAWRAARADPVTVLGVE